MIKCKDALENSACGKDICCIQCEKHMDCEFACSGTPDDCTLALTEEDALAVMKKEQATVIEAVAALTVQKKKIEEQEKKMRVQLMAAMEKYGVKKFENDLVKFTYVAPTTRTSIDGTKLKKELPDVAAKYSKTSNVSASVKIEVK